MKKVFSMVLTMAMFVSVFFIFLNSGTVHASSNDSESILTDLINPTNSETPISERKFTVEIASEHKEIDGNVIIPITFSNIPEKGIVACDMTIVYDQTQLEYICCDTGDIVINPYSNFAVNKAEDGLIKLLFLDCTMGKELITSDGTFINLTFKKLQSYDESASIKIPIYSFCDIDLNKIYAKIIPNDNDNPTPYPEKFFQTVIGSAKGTKGEHVTIPVSFVNVPKYEISTACITINYVPQILKLISITPGDIVPEPESNFSYSNPVEGFINFYYSKKHPNSPCISTDGVFAYITFEVLYPYDMYTEIFVWDSIFKDNVFCTIPDYTIAGCIDISGNESSKDFTITIASVQGYTNDLVTIPIYFSNVPSNDITSFKFILNYNPSQLEYISYELGELLKTKSICFDIQKESEGKLILMYLDFIEDPIYKDGLLINLTFKVTGSVGESTVYLTDSLASNRSLKPVYPVTIPGLVSILPSSSVYTVSGYIYSELENTDISNISFNEGFKVELIGTDFSALTDKNGYFEIKDVPAGSYTLKVTKTNYLTREIKDFTVEKDEQLASPIVLWIGDMEIDGKQDGAINMEDIMEICKAFNSVPGDTRYKETLDLNKDNAINFEDVMIVAKHFNKTSADY